MAYVTSHISVVLIISLILTDRVYNPTIGQGSKYLKKKTILYDRIDYSAGGKEGIFWVGRGTNACSIFGS